MATWDSTAARERIRKNLDAVKDVVIKDYVKDTNLEDLPVDVGYRVDGVHVYVDILNMHEMLGVTNAEREKTHRFALRFLNLHYRAVAAILDGVDAIHVDFHNQRLHAVVVKPYDDEAARIHRAIAMAQLVIDVLNHTYQESDAEEVLPAAKIRVGIDSGSAIAVNNGRRGNREPLFLGAPANVAAKRAGGGSEAGIFVTNNTRAAIGLSAVTDEDTYPLTDEQVSASKEEAGLEITVQSVVNDWSDDLDKNPLGKFAFSGHTPPMSSLDLETLSAANSRRQDSVSIYADLDGFTRYVSDKIDDDTHAREVVKTLHVLRSEMDAVTTQFGGLKIRFIGDCIHAWTGEGTAQTTDAAASIGATVVAAGALRNSFSLALDELRIEGIHANLGLQIGFDYGPIAVTRLGVRGDLIRCCIGRAVLASEEEQRRCRSTETAIGASALAVAPPWVARWFGSDRKLSDLTYDNAVARRDGSAAKSAPPSLLRPATAPAATGAAFAFPPSPAAPTKPAGFA